MDALTPLLSTHRQFLYLSSGSSSPDPDPELGLDETAPLILQRPPPYPHTSLVTILNPLLGLLNPIPPAQDDAFSDTATLVPNRAPPYPLLPCLINVLNPILTHLALFFLYLNNYGSVQSHFLLICCWVYMQYLFLLGLGFKWYLRDRRRAPTRKRLWKREWERAIYGFNVWPVLGMLVYDGKMAGL